MARALIPATAIHPAHALLLASGFPLFLGCLLSDWAYSATSEVQWINFAAWLNAGAMVFVGLALLWAVVDFFRSDARRDGGRALYLMVLIATFVLGLINALIHSKDAGATMPAGLILSVFVLLSAIAAVWLGFSSLRSGARQ